MPGQARAAATKLSHERGGRQPHLRRPTAPTMANADGLCAVRRPIACSLDGRLPVP
jgi:hypothetical protein